MSYSFVEYTGNGSSTTFTVPYDYISQTHVFAYLDGVLTTAYTWPTSSSIQFTVAPANGVFIKIARSSSPETPLVVYQDGSTLTQDQLQLADDQKFFLVQEALDTTEANLSQTIAGVYDAGNKRIINVADPIDAQDAVTKAYVDSTLPAAQAAAAASASAASGSASAAATTYDEFDDRYLGSKASAPTLDNDGNALLTGALYWNSASSQMFVWNGSAWAAASSANPTLAAISDGPLGQFSHRNKIINGRMDIAQRGTTFSSPPSGSLTLDRWRISFDGTGGARTISQAQHGPGDEHYTDNTFQHLRWNETAAGSGATYNALLHNIESVRTLNNEQVTFSFYAKADAARVLRVYLRQDFGSGGSPLVDTLVADFNVSTGWARYSGTVTLPSIAGKTLGHNTALSVVMYLPVGTTFMVDLTGVQLEAGPVATPFEHRDMGTEFLLCQRYYQKIELYHGGYGLAGTRNLNVYPLMVRMRVSPTATSLGDYGSGNVTAPTVVAAGATAFFWYTDTWATGGWSIDWGFQFDAEL